MWSLFGSFARGSAEYAWARGSAVLPRLTTILAAHGAAKLGAEYAEFKTCAAIYEAGGCERADAKEACCATCSLPARMNDVLYSDSGLWKPCDADSASTVSGHDSDCGGAHCQVSCTEVRLCEGPGHWGTFKKAYCKD